jgi:hypothetical protein
MLKIIYPGVKYTRNAIDAPIYWDFSLDISTLEKFS